jgi:hypothetical protein
MKSVARISPRLFLRTKQLAVMTRLWEAKNGGGIQLVARIFRRIGRDSPPRRVSDTEGVGGDSLTMDSLVTSLVDVSMTHLDGSTDAERRKKLSIERLIEMSMQDWPSSEELSLYCGESPPVGGRNPTNKARQQIKK